MAELLTEVSQTNIVNTYHCESQTNLFPEVAQGIVRDFSGRILALEEVLLNTAQMQVPDQSVLLMCCKQRDIWFSVHCSIAC